MPKRKRAATIKQEPREPLRSSIVEFPYDRDSEDEDGLQWCEEDSGLIPSIEIQTDISLSRAKRKLFSDGDRKIPGVRSSLVLAPFQMIGAVWLQTMEAVRNVGLLCDALGLGKSVQMLVHLAMCYHKEYGKRGDARCSGDKEKSRSVTLLVMKKHLIKQWVILFNRFTAIRVGITIQPLNILVLAKDIDIGTLDYPGRVKVIDKSAYDECQFVNYDLVFTTPWDVGREKEKADRIRASGLAEGDSYLCFSGAGLFSSHHFRRIIVDEAHFMANPNTWWSRGIFELASNAKFRWAITGTPIVNSCKDAFSLLHFVGENPYACPDHFREQITNNLSADIELALSRTRSALAPLMLRRHNSTIIDGKPILTLPRKHVIHHEVVLSPSERSRYQSQEHISSQSLQDLVDETEKMNLARKGFNTVNNLRYIAFHQASVELYGKQQRRIKIRPEDFDDLPNSSMIEAMLYRHVQRQHIRTDPKAKTVICVYFVHHAEITVRAFAREGYKVARYDPKVTAAGRGKALRPFSKHSETKPMNERDDSQVLVLTLSTGAAGLNLQEANLMLIAGVDYRYIPEFQAQGRIWRYGQEKEVFIHIFTAKDTIEEKIRYMQIAKGLQGAQCVGEELDGSPFLGMISIEDIMRTLGIEI